MKQIGTKQLNFNDVMSLHRDMTVVKTLNETLVYRVIFLGLIQSSACIWYNPLVGGPIVPGTEQLLVLIGRRQCATQIYRSPDN